LITLFAKEKEKNGKKSMGGTLWPPVRDKI